MQHRGDCRDRLRGRRLAGGVRSYRCKLPARDLKNAETRPMAGQSSVDMSLLYTLEDKAEQARGVRAFQERILGKPEGPVQ